MKEQKSTLFEKLIPFFVQDTKVFREEKFQWPQRLNNKVFKTQLWGKEAWSSPSLQQRCQSSRTFIFFDNIVPILDTVLKLTSIRNIIGSGLKRLATSSVPKRYQTSLFAQLSNTLPENVNFNLICPIFVIQKPPSKFTRYGVHLLKKHVSIYSWVWMV